MEKLIGAKEKIINICAEYFNDCVNVGGFETFREMKSSYDWEAEDIRSEIYSTINSFLNDLYKNGIDYEITLHDDCSLEIYENGWIVMSYKDLKREIFNLVK